MRSDFAYVDGAAQAAIAREDANLYISEEERAHARDSSIHVVAVWPIKDDSAEQKLLEESMSKRRKLLSAYHTAREEVLSKLRGLGLEPLAVLPSKFWSQICQDSELYRLEPNMDRKVRVDVEKLSTRIASWSTGVTVALFVAMGLGLFLLGTTFFDNWLMGMATVVAVALASWGIAAFVAGTRYERTGDVVLEWFEEAYLWVNSAMTMLCLPKTHKELLKLYFPNYTESASSDTKATLVLPPLPVELEQTMLKADKLGSLKVAAVADAIGFAESPRNILGRSARARADNSAQMFRQFIADPIIYFEHKGAVAVIAQFGDFPVEQEVIDRVSKNPAHLL